MTYLKKDTQSITFIGTLVVIYYGKAVFRPDCIHSLKITEKEHRYLRYGGKQSQFRKGE